MNHKSKSINNNKDHKFYKYLYRISGLLAIKKFKDYIHFLSNSDEHSQYGGKTMKPIWKNWLRQHSLS